MKQYLNLLENILNDGEWKEPARENMPKTLSLFGTRMEFDLSDGFPLLTTKKMYFKGIVVELLWFIKGDTNIKYLVDNGCNIWNSDAYRWYLGKCKEQNIIRTISFELFVSFIKNSKSIEELVVDSVNNSYVECPLIPKNYTLGDLGKVYGEQWRNQNGIDQLKTVINRLSTNPMGRYAILDAWNPSDFEGMALPPCHLLYQFNCVVIDGVKYLDLQLYQRSVDSGLGLPYNVASSALLLCLFAQLLGMNARKLVWVGGDTHIYENHIEQLKIQIDREPMELCKLNILKDLKSFDDLVDLEPSDIIIENYVSHPRIDMELKTGL